MKKIIGVIFFVMLSTALFAQTEADFIVELNAAGDGVVITKYTGNVLQVRIPATIQGMPVREIAEKAFNYIDVQSLYYSGRDNITSPVVSVIYDGYGNRPNNIVRQGITSIVIPEGVTKIGARAFAGMYDEYNSIQPAVGSLTSVTIPDSVTEIGDGAFSRQVSLTAVTLPAGLAKAGSGIFRGCTSLRNVTIPNGVTVLGDAMFAGCTALAAINIPAGVTGIGENAFNSSGLTSITWPASIPVITPASFNYEAGGMFENCTRLTSVTLPEGITAIGYRAFAGCTALTGITLPSTILEIQQDAFRGCTALTAVTIPESVKAIYFRGVSYGPTMNDKYGGLSTDSCPRLNLASQAALRRVGAGTWTLVIADGVTEIGVSAYSSRELDAVIIPPSVTAVGERAFNNSYIRSITIGADVNISESRSGLSTFEFGFTAVYEKNGKKAGIYRYDRNSNTWSYTE